MNTATTEGTKVWKKGNIKDNADIGEINKDIAKEISADTVDSSIITDGVVDELTQAQIIERGNWHLLSLHRNAGGVDDMGYVLVPNYVQSADYYLQYEAPQWVPDYVVNILKESKRRETRYNRRVDNGQPKMEAVVSETVCHPFTIEKTVNGVPDIVLKARRKGL